MTLTIALALVMAVMALISLLGIPARAQTVIALSRQAVRDMRSKELSELDKEKAVQAHARRMFVAFFVIAALFAVALLVPIALVALLAWLGFADYDAVLDATMSWPILLLATVLGLGILLFGKRNKPAAS